MNNNKNITVFTFIIIEIKFTLIINSKFPNHQTTVDNYFV